MSAELIKDLLFNTALLLSISIVYNLFLSASTAGKNGWRLFLVFSWVGWGFC
ncbi:hypothetical protein [uncultured Acetobacterium sp.]|uniref:hypothetical protein n=1 Tax=uncultured Acetobacterium sp. TaxID=217139 RepID=UPI0025E49DD9|nr:hypothetical protein [uncultured Acetobacterium sp.]